MDSIYNVKVNMVDEDLSSISSISYKIKNGDSLSEKEVFEFLNYIVFKTRLTICDVFNKDINEFDYRDTCNYAQAMLSYYFDDLGIYNVPVCTSKIFFNVIRHFFIVISLMQDGEMTSYIVDPTYNQFFNLEKCHKDRLILKDGIVRSTPEPGYFISLLDDDSKREVIKFLKCGFHKLDPAFAKIYGDSFNKTQIGISKMEHDNLFVSGNSYVKFFLKFKNELTKTREELFDMGLLLEVKNNGIKKV